MNRISFTMAETELYHTTVPTRYPYQFTQLHYCITVYSLCGTHQQFYRNVKENSHFLQHRIKFGSNIDWRKKKEDISDGCLAECVQDETRITNSGRWQNWCSNVHFLYTFPTSVSNHRSHKAAYNALYFQHSTEMCLQATSNSSGVQMICVICTKVLISRPPKAESQFLSF